MRALTMVCLLAAVGCRRESEPAQALPPSTPAPTPEVEAVPPPRIGATAEDENQLTPDEQARFDRMVEGTSPLPECNEVIRLFRQLSLCEKYPAEGRTMLKRGVLMLGELGDEHSSPELARSCKNVTTSMAGMLKQFGC